MNAAEDAVEDVAAVLGPDMYRFAPEGDHFLGEAVMVAFAGSLLGAFWRGFSAGLHGTVEQWGTEAAQWLTDRLRKAVTGSAGRDRDEAAQDAAAQAAEAAPDDGGGDRDTALDLAQRVLADALTTSGLPEDSASRYSQAVRAAAETMLNPEG
ncbi:hypothetical protein GCM10023148_10390 [Actinokineospora soli]